MSSDRDRVLVSLASPSVRIGGDLTYVMTSTPAAKWGGYIGYRNGDESIEGIIPPTTEPDAACIADLAIDFDAHGYPHESVEKYVQRQWLKEREEYNAQIREWWFDTCVATGKFIATVGHHANLVLSNKVDEKDSTIRSICKWANSPSRIGILSGPPGTGKSTAAAWWAWASTEGGGDENPHRVSAWLPAWITAAAFARSSRYGDDRKELLESRRLVLDDLGVEHIDKGGSIRTDIDELINTFYSGGARRDLLITTNLDAVTFEKRYGARVVDRLREVGTWIPCTGPSRRGKL